MLIRHDLQVQSRGQKCIEDRLVQSDYYQRVDPSLADNHHFYTLLLSPIHPQQPF